MINKAIKLKLQFFIHAYEQATYQRDPKYILTPNYIQICSELDLARTETRGQGHSNLESVGESPGFKMYLHTKYGMLP